MTHMIETKQLTYAYPREEGEPLRYALNGVDLTIDAGSFVVVLGHNGSGKSTLAKHFNAVLLPMGGGGSGAGGGHGHRRRGAAPGDPPPGGHGVPEPGQPDRCHVVEEDVAFGPENMGIPSQEIQERVDSALRTVGMESFALHAPHMLSGGQKQRIAIAGILAMEPRCIVLDEATAMLDPSGRREVLDTVSRLNREKGITIILITHHMDEAAYADRVLILNDGVVALDGAPGPSSPRWRSCAPLAWSPPTRWSCWICCKGTAGMCPWTPSASPNVPTPSAALWARAERGPRFYRNTRMLGFGTDYSCGKLSPYLRGEGTPFCRSAVDGISLDIYPGEFLGVIGHNRLREVHADSAP